MLIGIGIIYAHNILVFIYIAYIAYGVFNRLKYDVKAIEVVLVSMCTDLSWSIRSLLFPYAHFNYLIVKRAIQVSR